MYSTVYTVGHSNHPIDRFLCLLLQHQVTVVADVRSVPYSRFNPQFNRDSFSKALQESGIRYVYLGRELGGRADDPACYSGGQLRYDRVASTELFMGGVARLANVARTCCVALMCAEKEPLDCHRTLLVVPVLVKQGFDVVHIHADGDLESHDRAMDRLLDHFDLLPDDDVFRRLQPRAELIAEAIARQAGVVAHVDQSIHPPIKAQ